MEVKALISYLEEIEKKYPDSEIVIDIGRKDIFDWKQVQLLGVDSVGIDIAIGTDLIEPGDEFRNGKTFVIIVPENIVMR